jgi:hypothetical protein
MDSFWTTYSDYIVGIPALFISTAVAVWVFIKQKNVKRLEYKILANESLISYSKKIEDELVVTFGGKKVKNLLLLNLEIINSGNTPILKSDFDSNVRISFPDVNAILSIKAEPIDPNYQYPEIFIEVDSKKGRHIEVLPLLMNPMDSFSIKFLIDTDAKEVHFDIASRIVGIKSIQDNSNKNYRKSLRTFGFIYSFLLVGFLFSITFNKPDNPKQWILVFSLLIINFSMVLIYFYLSISKKINK